MVKESKRDENEIYPLINTVLKNKNGSVHLNKDGNFRTAKITYDMFLNKPLKPKNVLSKDIKKELDYLREGGDLFEPDFDLDD